MKKLHLLCVAFCLVFTAGATAYPNKPITIIVPSNAGGGTDITARIFIEVAKKYWTDAEFIVKNVPSSGGQKGFQQLVKARPDGHTIGLIFTPQLISHIITKRARYSLADMNVLGNLAEDPSIIVVPENSPINNMEELLAATKKKPLKATINGIGSDDHIAVNTLMKQTSSKFILIPTAGSTDQKAGILGAHFDVAFMNLSQIFTQYKAGKVKIIAGLTQERHPTIPKVATAIEQGHSLLMTATRGMAAPKKLPPEVLAKLNDLFEKVMADEEFYSRAEKSYIFPLPMTGEEYLTYLQTLEAEVRVIHAENPWQ